MIQHTTYYVALLKTWKKYLYTSGKIGQILLDLSKAYDCISHNLLVRKIEACGLRRNALELVYRYTENRAREGN